MGFEAQFLKLMPHTVTLMAPTGKNAQGDSTYVGGIDVPYRARIVGDILALRMATKDTQSQAFLVYLAPSSDPISTEYRLTLPVDPAWQGPNPIIYAIERETDETGHHHVKLICGFAFHHQTQL